MVINLNKNIKSRILNGHPWIYKNEIKNIPNDVTKGEIVDVFHENNFLGRGYYNEDSLITIRLLTRKNHKIDQDFFDNKIEKALKYRKRFINDNSFRLFFSESDGIPGLIVDKFEDYLVMQINTFGAYEYKDLILNSLIKFLGPKGIFEKDDERSAKIEGFTCIEGWVYKKGPEIIPFQIDGINFFSDTKGQKTGFFLDQRINAKKVMEISENLDALDAFSYTGNFGLHVLKGGAKKVTFIDYSERALNILENTLKANSIDSSKYEIINGNSFDILKMFDETSRYFDMTIIDPPSLAKSRKSKKNAFRGYKELNLRAMKITKNNGILVTSSCTQIIFDEEFSRIIFEAMEDTHKILKLVHKGYQSPDHPIQKNIFETEYLKNYIFLVDDKNNY
ncbi:MAG: rRNA (cytosine1962-C5)-methyltransferase [Geotoga sp.]|nr:rRNA (cytosine1962-C5)-methyltransferase [Geotoga sp.]